jgi:hypothetical protein
MTAHGQHKRLPLVFRPAIQTRIAAIDLIAYHPRPERTGRPHASQHTLLPAAAWSQKSPHWNACLLTVRGIACPTPREVEFTVDEGPALASGMGHKYTQYPPTQPCRGRTPQPSRYNNPIKPDRFRALLTSQRRRRFATEGIGLRTLPASIAQRQVWTTASRRTTKTIVPGGNRHPQPSSPGAFVPALVVQVRGGLGLLMAPRLGHRHR